MKKSLKGLFAFVCAAMTLMGLGACSNDADPAPSPGVTALEPTPSVSATPKEVPLFQVPMAEINKELGVVNAAAPTSDQFGTFNQVTLDPAAPAAAYDPAVNDSGSLARFGREGVAAARLLVLEFAVSEGADSSLVFDASPEAVEDWLSRNLSKVHSQHQAEFADAFRATPAGGDFPAVEGPAQSWRSQPGVTPRPYKESEPRLYFEGLVINSVKLSDNDFLDMDVSLDYRRPILVEGRGYIEKVNLQQTYRVSPEETGEWKIVNVSTVSKVEYDTASEVRYN